MSYPFIQAAANAPPKLSYAPSTPGKSPWASWLGEPLNGYNMSTPYDATDRETWQLPEGLRGESAFLGNTMTLLAFANNSPVTTFLFPIKIDDNNLQVHWSHWDFQPALPTVTPELAPVRIVRSQRTQHRQALIRYGIGVQLEWGFMDTPLGQEHYKMSLAQINMAFTEGLNYQGLEAIIYNGDVFRRAADDLQIAPDAKWFESVIRRELNFWAIIQRDQNPMAGLVNTLNNINSTFNQNTDLTWFVTPKEIIDYLELMPLMRDNFYIGGRIPEETDPVNVKSGTYTDRAGNNFVVLRNYASGIEGPINPFERRVQIGEYFVASCPMRGQSYSNYNSTYRTIEIYSQDKDGWEPIDLRTMLDSCMRFDPKTGYIRKANNPNPNSSKNGSVGLGVAELAADMFYYLDEKNRLQTVGLFGDINEYHLGVGGYVDMANSFLAKVYGTVDKNILNDTINKITTLVLSLNRNSLYNRELNDFLKMIATDAVEKELTPNDYQQFGLIWEPNIDKAFDLPIFEESDQAPSWKNKISLPGPYLSFEGWSTIARYYDSYREKFSDRTGFNTSAAKTVYKFMDLLGNLFRYIQTVFPGALDPYTGQHDLFNRFIESILKNPLPSLYLSSKIHTKGTNAETPTDETTLRGLALIANAVTHLEEFSGVRALTQALYGMEALTDPLYNEDDIEQSAISAQYGVDIPVLSKKGNAMKFGTRPKSTSDALTWLGRVLRPRITKGTLTSVSKFRDYLKGVGLHALILITLRAINSNVWAKHGTYKDSKAEKIVNAIIDALGDAHNVSNLSKLRFLDASKSTFSNPNTVFVDRILEFFADKENAKLLSSNWLTDLLTTQNAKTGAAIDNAAAILDEIKEAIKTPQRLSLAYSDDYIKTNLVFTEGMASSISNFNSGNKEIAMASSTLKRVPAPPPDVEKSKIDLKKLYGSHKSSSAATLSPSHSFGGTGKPKISKENTDLDELNTLVAQFKIARKSSSSSSSTDSLLSRLYHYIDVSKTFEQYMARSGLASVSYWMYMHPNENLTTGKDYIISEIRGILERVETKDDTSRDIEKAIADNKAFYEEQLSKFNGSENDIERFSKYIINYSAGLTLESWKKTPILGEEDMISTLNTAIRRYVRYSIDNIAIQLSTAQVLFDKFGTIDMKPYDAIKENIVSQILDYEDPFKDQVSTSQKIGAEINLHGLSSYMRQYQSLKDKNQLKPTPGKPYFQKIAAPPPPKKGKQVHIPGTTSNYRYNMDVLKNKQMSPLMFMICVAFMNTPVTKQNLEAFIVQDVMFPFNFIIQRPHIRHRTMTLTYMAPGEQTGTTRIGRVRVVLGDDTMIGFHHMRLTYYSATIVTEPKNILNANNALVTDYDGGGGHIPYTSIEGYKPSHGMFGTRGESLFVMMTPWNELEYPDIFYLTGRKPVRKGLSGDILSPLTQTLSTLSCSAIAYYSILWGWVTMNGNLSQLGIARGGYDAATTIRAGNSLTFPGMYRKRNAHGELHFESPKGHWPATLTYSGCARARCAKQAPNPHMMFK